MKQGYLVEGDHPIFKRIYSRFKTFSEASKLIIELIEYNYENIKLNGKEIVNEDHTNI